MPLLSTVGAASSRGFGGGRYIPPVITGDVITYFPGSVGSISMTTEDLMTVYSSYDVSGQNIDSISWQVNFNGGAPTQWTQSDFSAVDTKLISVDYGSGNAGWSGAGTYRFFSIFRRTASGLYDVYTNVIVLTVTAA